MAEAAGGLARPAALVEPGLWVDRRVSGEALRGRRALFVDRDGTLIVDTGYPRRPEEVALRPAMLPVLKAAAAAGMPVVVVTNQSGIARGLLGWAEFAAVDARMHALLAGHGIAVAMVLACAYHESGTGPLHAVDHPMRKPNPGMLLRAAEAGGLVLAGSLMIGDKHDDVEAGRRAGVGRALRIAEDGRFVPGGAGAPLTAAELAATLAAPGR
ncbi:HAD-IIIA family hydrolase [Aquibium sp. A9E412]|uniref:D-glycero-alpha-D-manno-heptose-1,7-bisphosphate 7-phosphatase n=1 Tax=Aquibium sp. A9E412 TaxID=2976767 RepID=UPI0025B0216F|nr:HAD-IIIA family hydrolase [Aquibium sp. A9E412]MDN2565459.1 HAD-IIIA family hydrolase [Aquibium sp. A9E412]